MQVMEELNEMSLVNFEGLRFPKIAVEHEVDSFLASGHGADPFCMSGSLSPPHRGCTVHQTSFQLLAYHLTSHFHPISLHAAKPQRSQMVQEGLCQLQL